MLKKASSRVLGLEKSSTYLRGTSAVFPHLRPRWQAFLNILRYVRAIFGSISLDASQMETIFSSSCRM
jgi:hypothetical protein